MSPLRAMIKAYIDAQQDNYCIAVFTKKDGTERRMPFRPSEASEHLDPNATEKGKAIARQTIADNPHIMRVWDCELEEYRSINLDKIKKLSTKDGVMLFARDADFKNVSLIIEK